MHFYFIFYFLFIYFIYFYFILFIYFIFFFLGGGAFIYTSVSYRTISQSLECIIHRGFLHRRSIKICPNKFRQFFLICAPLIEKSSSLCSFTLNPDNTDVCDLYLVLWSITLVLIWSPACTGIENNPNTFPDIRNM